MTDGRLRMLGRATRRRCPLCGSGGIFRGWFDLRARCPGCNFPFEREEGYWVGALIANIAAAETLFAVLLVGGVVLTYPAVPWTALTVAGMALMVALPIGFYPLSKTLWLWVDLAFLHPVDADDLARNAPPADDERPTPGERNRWLG
ncbi:MAG: DUF983 domain-containing protein [Egibacteraceae bacterium]